MPKKGYQQTPEHRAAIRQAMEERRPWQEISGYIMNAANAGDAQLASELLKSYMEQRQAEHDVGEPADLDALFAETERIHAEIRSKQEVRPASTHVITAGSPDAVPAARAPRPSLTARQRELNAMWNLALPELTDREATQIARELERTLPPRLRRYRNSSGAL